MTNPLLDLSRRIVVGHRGDRTHVAENTIESLRSARDAGADALEFDVRCSRDGIPLLMHDAQLDRTTNGHGLLSAYTFAELRSLDAGAHFTPRASGPLLIPSLEEVLTQFPDIPIVIDVKDTASAEPTIALLRKTAAASRTVVGSSTSAGVAMFAAAGFNTCATMGDAIALLPKALAGMTPRPPAYQALSITPSFHGVPIPVVRMAKAARKVGVATHVWTVNTPELAERYWQGGVTAVLTDDPTTLVRFRPQ